MRIAIVGAGPAGSYLAWQLAGTPHEILLFDPLVPGYEKPCGGGLSPVVGRRFPDVMALPFPRHRSSGVVLRASDCSQIEQAYDTSNWAIVSRAEFGRILLDRALANDRVRHVQQQVTSLERSGQGWSLCTGSGEVFDADFVVGADGVRSMVRRQVVGPIPRQHLGLAVGYWVHGAPDTLAFQTYADMEGYLWSFPRRDHASVGICTRLDALSARELWQRVDRFLLEACPGAVKQDRYTALLPLARDASLWSTPCAEPGWALLGDAAGHVHPLTGEGIAYALWSARLLAETFDSGAPMAYDRLWREHYGHILTASSQMLGSANAVIATYEVWFHLALGGFLPASGHLASSA